MAVEQPIQFASDNSSSFESQLIELLRIRSISTDPAYAREVVQGAEWLVSEFHRMGIDNAQLNETSGHPVVTASVMVDDKLPTILVYGHYDVQPPDPLDLWTSPPFEPVVKDGNLYARGSCDDKGQMFMYLKAVESYLATETPLPVNVKFLIEGEEESGSDHLPEFLETNKRIVAGRCSLDL